MTTLVGLKTVRSLLHFSVPDLAARIGVEPPTYYRYERGERRIYLDKAATLANHMGVTVDQLLREPDEAERVELFLRGEKRRDLLAKTGGDEGVANALSAWSDDEEPGE